MTVLYDLFSLFRLSSLRKLYSQWSAELSGLATGRSVQEYLPAGKSEQDSLVALFAAIPAVEANSIFTSSASDILKFSNVDGNARNPVTGTWSRLVLLGRRVTDKDSFRDVDEDMRRAVVSSITGTLCSPTCLKEARAIATMLCFARCILTPQLSNESETAAPFLERYECWLRDLVQNPDAAVVPSLLFVLSELVPLESVHFLKLHHRIFFRNRGLFHLASTYVAQLRSRIRDFDPTFSNVAAESKSTKITEPQTSNTVSAKVMNEIVQFVSSYKEKRELPKLLIRHMNFHRYHFRKVMVPLLLHPNFVDLKPPDGDVPITLDAATFDERRIDMIREIAFRRKDHAIAGSEAKAAIDAINAARSERDSRFSSKSKTPAKPVLSSSSVNGTSSNRDIITAILRDEVRHGPNELAAEKDHDQIEKAKELLCANVGNCIDKCNDTGALASVAVDVLESLCSAVEDLDGSEVPRAESVFETTRVQNFSDSLDKYKSWWRRVGLRFISLLSYFMGDIRLSRIQTHIRYQLLALFSVRIDSVSEKSLFSLAIIMVALVILRSKTALRDLCFISTTSTPKILRHLSRVVFECLPLSSPHTVLPSTTFAVYYVSLLRTFPEDALLSLNVESDISIDATLAYNGHESVITEFASFPQALLRWVVSSPWRLTRGNEDAIRTENEVITPEASTLCQQALFCFSDVVFFDDGSKALAALLNLELRAGWGCKFSIASQLRVVQSLYLSSMAVVNEVAKFLAVAKKKHHSSLDWIHQGLQLFFDGCSDSFPSSIDDSATTNIRKCVEEAGIEVAYDMIDCYRSMELSYFEGCDDACEHITRILVLKFWPLSRQIAAYLLRCVLSHDVTIAQQIDPFFVANCTLALDSIGESIFLADLSVGSGHDILKIVKEVAHESKTILQQGCRGDLEYQSTNGNAFRTQGNLCTTPTLSLLDAHALGIALSMRLLTETQYSEASSDIVRQIVSVVVVRVGSPAACDVLDGITGSIALLQCNSRRQKRYLPEAEELRWNSLLSSFVEERVDLSEGKGNKLPFWAKSRLLEGLELVGEGGGTLFREWFDSARENNVQNEIQECIARLISALGGTKDGVVERIIQALGHDKVVDTLLPNLGWGFVQTKEIQGAAKAAVRRQLIDTIGRIAGYLRPEVGGDFVAGAMNRFGTHGVEILALLRSRGFR